MTPEALIAASRKAENGTVRVSSKTGKLYDIEGDVVEVWAGDLTPCLVYGWAVNPHPRAPKAATYLKISNIELAQGDRNARTA